MPLLFRYIFRQNLYAFAFAAVVVSFVVLLTQSFRLLAIVVDNSGTMTVFLRLMGLTLPTLLPLVAPIGLGIAIIFSCYKLDSDSELVVMRSAGVSRSRLAMPILALAMAVTAAGYCMTLWLTPAANRELVRLQYYVRDNFSPMLLRAGTFNDLTDGLTFYSREHGRKGEMLDILVHDVRKPKAPVTIMAEKGVFSTTADGEPQVVVFKGRRQEIDPDTGKMSQLDFDTYALDLRLLRNGMAKRLPDPRELTVSQLLDPPKEREKRRASLERMAAELHQRLASPLLAIDYAAIAVLFMLAGEFNRRGMARRIVLATATMVAVQVGILSLENLMGKYAWLAPAYYGAVALPAIVCLFLLFSPDILRKKSGKGGVHA